MMLQLPVVVVLLTLVVYSPVNEGIFTLPPRPSRPTGAPTPLRCDSVLVQNNPDNYPHCWCVYNQWTDWKYTRTTENRTCVSNQVHILKRIKSSLSSKCSNRTVVETKYICEPTPEAKINKLAAVLFLGPVVEEPTAAPTVLRTTLRPSTSITSNPRTATPSRPSTSITSGLRTRPTSRPRTITTSSSWATTTASLASLDSLLREDPNTVVARWNVENPCEVIGFFGTIPYYYYFGCISHWVIQYYINTTDGLNALCSCTYKLAPADCGTLWNHGCYSDNLCEKYRCYRCPIYQPSLCITIETAVQRINYYYGPAGGSRNKRNIIYTCPETLEEKDICRGTTEVCKVRKGYTSITKRATVNNHDTDRVNLASLIMYQDELYKPHVDRVKRALPPANRSVLFVLDASGSIRQAEFDNVTSFLADIAMHLCGEVAIGLLTYSTHIRMHFCPTCSRDDDISEADYRVIVKNKIKSVQYHGHFTFTGEVLKCLTNHIMSNPDCVFLQTKPTHIVFFTDGRANGCQDVTRAAEELGTQYQNAEIYAIGIGSIDKSGVSDLQTRNNDAIFFNFNTLGLLLNTWDSFKAEYINTSDYACLPVYFG